LSENPLALALAMVEVDSVATGLRCVDTLVKQAPVRVLEANLVEPGRFLVLFRGGVAEVEESYREALDRAADAVVDRMLLARVHPALLEGLEGHEALGSSEELDTIGVIEGSRVAGTLEACDRSLKDAGVQLVGVRVSGGLGGRAYYVVRGLQHDVEVAVEVAESVLRCHGALHRTECIARPHPEMVCWLMRTPPFRVGGTEGLDGG
jgi:microcompartment protein CcmL/EutN